MKLTANEIAARALRGFSPQSRANTCSHAGAIAILRWCAERLQGPSGTVYVLTMYDPAASFGYTEVFYTLKSAMRHAGVKGWRKRGDTFTWVQQDHEVRVRAKHGLISWTEDSAVYKIRRKRVRGKP